MNANFDDVREMVKIFLQRNSVVEIRILGAQLADGTRRGVLSGYFNDPEAVVNALSSIETASGCYITLNRIKIDPAKVTNTLSCTKHATKDTNIEGLKFLLVDIDPVRPSGQSATETEKEYARACLDAVVKFLAKQGWPTPIIADSGNGYHVLCPISLPKEDGGLVKEVLDGLSKKFSTEHCKIDVVNCNPSRLTKLYGTMVCKGPNSPERPCRQSKLLSVPENLIPVSKEQLTNLIAELGGRRDGTKFVPKGQPTRWGKAVEEVENFIARHKIPVRNRKEKTDENGGVIRVVILRECPFNPDHGDHQEVAILVYPDGKIVFKCHHNSCRDKKWEDFRRHYEPDNRPRILLPDKRTYSEFAAELGKHLRGQPIFIRDGQVVILQDGKLRPITKQEFRTWIERYVVCVRREVVGGELREVPKTMSLDLSDAVLHAPSFLEQLRPLRQVYDCRLPVRRPDGRIELLPYGYDEQTQIYAYRGLEYDENMSLEEARAVLNDLVSEFIFSDGENGKSLALAAMVGLYVSPILPEGTLRPCIVIVANAEGAGKTLLAQCIVTPTLGEAPTATAPEDEEEMRKLLTTAIAQHKKVLCLDNVKGYLSSPALEQFTSAVEYEGRRLGTNRYIRAKNLTLVIITGNGLTLSPDLVRRSLIIRLHQPCEHPEQRKFKRILDIPMLLALRPKVLAALWALVRNWVEKRCPLPCCQRSSFPAWIASVVGILEAAGYPCPLKTLEAHSELDELHEGMVQLVRAMEPDRQYTFQELIAKAITEECFPSLLPAKSEAVTNKDRVRFSRVLARYVDRQVGGFWFRREGKNRKNRTYKIEPIKPNPDIPGDSHNPKSPV